MNRLKAWLRYETRTAHAQGELEVSYVTIAGKVKDAHGHWTRLRTALEAAGFRVEAEAVPEHEIAPDSHELQCVVAVLDAHHVPTELAPGQPYTVHGRVAAALEANDRGAL